MTKWSLRPDPGPHDPARHVLLIKGEMKHVSQIVKKFGAMCGRPLKTDHPEGFNISIYLHGITKTGVDKVARYLGEIAPGAQGDLALAAPAPTLPVIPFMVREVPSVPAARLFSGTQAAPAASPIAEPMVSGPVLTPPTLTAPVFPETLSMTPGALPGAPGRQDGVASVPPPSRTTWTRLRRR